MAFPFTIDLDKIADIGNSILSNLITAIIVFVFVYIYRNKPKIKAIGGIHAWPRGIRKDDNSPLFDMIFFEIYLLFINESIYDASSFSIKNFGNTKLPNFKLEEYKTVISANGTLKVRASFWISDPEVTRLYELGGRAMIDGYVARVNLKYYKNTPIYISYRKSDNRLIESKVVIKLSDFYQDN